MKTYFLMLMILLSTSAQAVTMDRWSKGSLRFCQEFNQSFEGKTAHPTPPYIVSQMNLALEEAGAPKIEVTSCQLTQIKKHLLGFKSYRYNYSLSYMDVPSDCNGLISKIVKVDMSQLSQLQSGANEDAYKMILDIARSLGFVVIAEDIEGMGFYFNSVTLGIKDCQLRK